MQQFWMVVAGAAPYARLANTERWETEHLAREEAKRLAATARGVEFYVVMAIEKVVAVDVHVEKLTAPECPF